jgi:hypothetical protein
LVCSTAKPSADPASAVPIRKLNVIAGCPAVRTDRYWAFLFHREWVLHLRAEAIGGDAILTAWITQSERKSCRRPNPS